VTCDHLQQLARVACEFKMNHRLSQIKITNYKSIIDEIFDLSDYTALVGYNNAGKSNILSAIKWLLRRTSLSSDCFNQADQPIIIEGKIEGISSTLLQTMDPGHKTSIEKYVIGEVLKIRQIQNSPGDTVAKIKIEVYDDSSNKYIPNPNGLTEALSVLFPEPIQIGAMENAEEDVSKSKAGTTIAKLLAEILGPIESQYGMDVKNALDGVKGLLSADGNARVAELTNFDTQVNSKIDSFFLE
jgi:putative ATP-dependent endonuclease of OLD family